MTVDFEEHGTAELGIPSLTTRRTRLPSGEIRAVVTVTKTKWDKEKKRPYSAGSKTVGIVADNREFGPIIFKEEFLEQYPQLREVTVLRKEGRQYVYINTPLKVTAQTVVYHKQGRKRYAPPQSASKTKLYGATMMCSKVAEHFQITQSLQDVFGKRHAALILAIAIALIVLRRGSLSAIKNAADFVFLSTEKLPLSPSSMTKLCKSITSGLGQKYCGLLMARLYKLFPGLDAELQAVDGSSIASYSQTNPLVEYGHPKKDNPGIPQFNLIFIVHMITGIPCYFRLLAGNVNDKSAYKNDSDYCCSMLEWASQFRDVLNIKVQMTHVFDRGYASMRVMNCAVEHGFDFVCCMPNNLRDTKEALAYAAQHKIEQHGDIIDDAVRHIAVPKRNCHTITSTSTGKQKRLMLHVYHDANKEYEVLGKLLDMGSSLIAAHKSNTYDSLSKKIKDLDKRIKLVGQQSDGKWYIDINAAKQEAIRASRLVLSTTREDFNGEKVLTTYKHREQVENAFRSFKGLGFNRLGSGKFNTMFGRMFLFLISCQIEMGLLYLAKQAKDGLSCREPTPQEKKVLSSMPELINLMNGITCQVEGKEIKVNEIAGLRRRVLDLLGIPVVAANYEDSDDESIWLANLTNEALAELYTPQDAAEEGLSYR